ncbi:MAG: hypothetical protein M1470_07180 [Bacteroidetes bacterium]|nr:hypothetical protein [Bacteroidota bacterium]
MRISFALAVFFLITSKALAQIQDSTGIPSENSILTGFSQNINTLGWSGIAGKDWNADDYSISINENFHSVLIKGQQNLIRDEQNFNGQIRRSIFGNISGFGVFQSNFVSDNRQIGLNSVGASTISSGLYFATQRDTVLGGIGNKWDKQAGVNDNGFTYDLHAATAFSPFDGSRLVPSLTLHNEQISPRQNYDRAASVGYFQSFPTQASISFLGSYGMQLRDFYFPADSVVKSTFNVENNIQDRNENRSSVSAGLSMPILFFQLSAQSRFGQRQIELTYRYNPTNDPSNVLYDTRIRVSNFDFNSQLTANVFGDTLYINMGHTERTETHAVINSPVLNAFTEQQIANQAQLNNVGTRNTISGQFLMHFGNTSANLTGIASLFRYDTPSVLNYDDRDELTNTIALLVNHQFSPSFQSGLGIEGDLIHIVYITAQRSANNNRNFVYKLFPIVIYSDSRVRTFNRFEVLANYTVYDFEAYSQVHSFSFRQASFLDSTTVNLTSKVSAFFLGNVKLYTRGELYWSSFSEFPLNYFVDQTYWLSLFYFTGSLRYGAGYRYLSLTQYNFITATEKQFASRQTNAGPTAFISLSMSHLELRIDGWYQISKQSLQNQIVYPNFELTARYNF